MSPEDEVSSVRFRFLIVRLLLLVAFALGCGQTSGAPRAMLSGRDPATLFRPFNGERISLSRDGQRVAFTHHDRRQLKVIVLTLAPTPSRLEFTIDDIPYAGIADLAWSSPDRLVLATLTPVIFTLDLTKKTVRRVMDSTLFDSWTSDQSGPRAPRWLGLVAGQPGFAWVEGISHTVADDQDPFSPSAEPTFDDSGFSETTPTLDEEPAAMSTRAGASGGSRSIPRVQVTELVKLNLETGEWESVSSISDRHETALFYDQQGHPRFKLTQAESALTFHYRPADTGFFERWQPLARWLGPSARQGFRVTAANFIGERSWPVGFDLDPNVLYYASNVGSDTHSLHALDLRTKTSRELMRSPAGFDVVDPLQRPAGESLLFDRSTQKLVGVRHRELDVRTQWLDTDLESMQIKIEANFPRRQVQLVEWDDPRTHFLIEVTAENDPGRFFVFHRADGRLVECLRRAPWLTSAEAHRASSFDFITPTGLRLTGRLTLPRASLVSPPPLIIWLHDGPWQRTPAGYSREAQALGDLGFVVVQLDYPGSSGLGRRHRQPGPGAYDRQVLDACLAALGWVGTRQAFDSRRVVIAGEGIGGYLALRAVALQPGTFRCAISINGPTHPDQLGEVSSARRQEEKKRFLDGMRRYTEAMQSWDGRSRLPQPPMAEPEPVNFSREVHRWFFSQGDRPVSVLQDAAKLTKPILLLHDPAHPSTSIEHVQALAKEIKRRKGVVEYKPIDGDYAQGGRLARLPVFIHIRDFLNENLYQFDVEIGETKERN